MSGPPVPRRHLSNLPRRKWLNCPCNVKTCWVAGRTAANVLAAVPWPEKREGWIEGSIL